MQASFAMTPCLWCFPQGPLLMCAQCRQIRGDSPSSGQSLDPQVSSGSICLLIVSCFKVNGSSFGVKNKVIKVKMTNNNNNNTRRAPNAISGFLENSICWHGQRDDAISIFHFLFQRQIKKKNNHKLSIY